MKVSAQTAENKQTYTVENIAYFNGQCNITGIVVFSKNEIVVITKNFSGTTITTLEPQFLFPKAQTVKNNQDEVIIEKKLSHSAGNIATTFVLHKPQPDLQGQTLLSGSTQLLRTEIETYKTLRLALDELKKTEPRFCSAVEQKLRMIEVGLNRPDPVPTPHRRG